MNAIATRFPLGALAALFIGTAALPGAGSSRAADKDTLALPRVGFACCNLHYEKDWISDGNYAGLPFLPAGTPVKVLSLGRHKAYAEINGKKMRFGHDYGRDQESLEQWISKIVVEQDPTPRVQSYPAAIQAAINEGRVMVGMTKEEAITSIGYPLTSETPSLETPVWRHWVSSFEEYQLRWGSDGKLKEIIAVPTVSSRVVHAD